MIVSMMIATPQLPTHRCSHSSTQKSGTAITVSHP